MKYLNYIVRRHDIKTDLTPNEQALLNAVFMMVCAKRPMTVMQLVELDKHGSQATLHRRMSKLIKDGYLTKVVDEQDNRVKYVTLTKKAWKFFMKVEEIMEAL